MIEAQDLTKIYGGKAAVDHLSFTVEPGRVTGFLGPNGAGKSTTMRLDEPVNGLDPEGVLWIRNLMKSLAAEGRTVLVSSHLMNEMAVTADHLIVIGRGKLITEASTEDVIARSTDKSVRVRTPDADRLAEMIAAAGGKVVRGGAESGTVRGAQNGAGLLTVTGLEAPRIGEL